MPGFSDYTAGNVLAYLTGKTAMPTLPTAYVALFTVAPTSDAGTGGTEVTGGAYARVSTTGPNWNVPSASSGTEPATTPASTSNSATISFPTATANWGTVVAFGLYDAATSGNLLAFDFLGNYSWLPASISAASPGVVTSPAHGYSNGDPVVVTTKYGGTLPTLSAGSFSAILTVANATTDTFTLTTAGAVALNTSASGDFQVRKIVQQSIPTNVAASFVGGSPGALVLTSA